MILFYLVNFTLTLAKLLSNSLLTDNKIFIKIFIIPIVYEGIFIRFSSTYIVYML